jgi:citrate lyase subunit beta/citryl-CoA lyase
MITRSRRSALYLPASNVRAIEKARTLECDVVILDLEDAVAPDSKAAARAQAVAALRNGGFGGKELVVRVNALSTEWGLQDCRALVGAKPDAILIPKVENGESFDGYRAILDGIPLWAMIETASAVMNLAQIAATPGLGALVVGTNDLALELGARAKRNRIGFVGTLAATVVAARSHRLAVLDGVFNSVEDDEGFAAECVQGADFGFDGKTLIHPNQIRACNAAFSPDEEEIAWATRIEQAFADPTSAGKGALRLDGKMVERLHLDLARRILAVSRDNQLR